MKTSNLAAKMIEPIQHGSVVIGLAVGSSPRGWLVSIGGRELEATRAAMCLLEPRPGDEVLIAEVGERRFVLGVLARAPGSAARLSVEGDLELAVAAGALRVTAQRGVEVTTPAEASVTAARASLRALSADAVVEKARLLGGLLQLEATKVSTLAGTVETLCERLWQRAERAYRFVEGLDQLRAGNIDQRARQLARLHADNTVITAKHLAKVDAEQIHMG